MAATRSETERLLPELPEPGRVVEVRGATWAVLEPHAVWDGDRHRPGMCLPLAGLRPVVRAR